MSENKNRSWTTGLPMNGLINPERAPDVITVEFNGTTTKLAKEITGRDQSGKPTSVKYVGHPVGPDGRACRFGMSIETNGFVRGSGAMNFIAQGGWSRGTSKPNSTEKHEARQKFIQGFIFSALMFQGSETDQEMRDLIEKETGTKVVDGEITEKDRELYGLLGIKAYLVKLAETRNIRFEPDLKSYISRSVQPTYAKVVEGEWDEESDEVALTSALTQAHVQLLKGAKLKFRKERVKHARKARANSGS